MRGYRQKGFAKRYESYITNTRIDDSSFAQSFQLTRYSFNIFHLPRSHILILVDNDALSGQMCGEHISCAREVIVVCRGSVTWQATG